MAHDMSDVTRLWSPNNRFTVKQALEDALAEVDDYELEHVIVLGTYKGGTIMLKPSRITMTEANWLLDRAKHDCLRIQRLMDDENDESYDAAG